MSVYHFLYLELDEEERELIDRAEKEFMKAIESGKKATQEPDDIIAETEENAEVTSCLSNARGYLLKNNALKNA